MYRSESVYWWFNGQTYAVMPIRLICVGVDFGDITDSQKIYISDQTGSQNCLGIYCGGNNVECRLVDQSCSYKYPYVCPNLLQLDHTGYHCSSNFRSYYQSRWPYKYSCYSSNNQFTWSKANIDNKCGGIAYTDYRTFLAKLTSHVNLPRGYYWTGFSRYTCKSGGYKPKLELYNT